MLLICKGILFAEQNGGVEIANYTNLSDKQKFQEIYKYINNYKYQFPEQAFKYANDALVISQRVNDVNQIIKSKMLIGSCFKVKGDYKTAIEQMEEALSMAKLEKNDSLQASILIALGDLYGLISKYNVALNYNLEALKINKRLNYKSGIAESYHNIAIVYYYILNLEKAREYNYQALKLYKELKDTSGIAKSLSNIALVLSNIDSLDKALYYNFQALDLFKRMGNEEGIGNAYTNIGITYINKKNYEEALKYLNSALTIFSSGSFQRNQLLVLANLSNAYLMTGKHQEALNKANEGYKLASQSQSSDLMAIIYNLYSQIYSRMNDFENAFKYERAFVSIRDSIFNEENRNKISELEVRIETENKSIENELLRKTNRLQMILFVVAGVFVIVIIVILFYRNKSKQQTNKLLEEKNKIISEHNLALEKLNMELNEANVAKDKFFSIMAHDLKSPLWWFKNVTDLLAHKYDELSKEKILEITKVLDDSAQTSLHLIENLLQWSRSQSGTIEFIPEKINLSHVFKHIMAHHRLHAEGKNIKIEISCPENAEMIADKNMLYSILRNLISNAIKFTQSGGIVKIDFQEDEQNWTISVADSGVGIPDNEIEKIFRIDIRTTTLGTAQEKGTGLGLILTKEFIERHGGKLSIESIPDKGTKFVFSIPKK
jgi:signal transduction histidine kinase